MADSSKYIFGAEPDYVYSKNTNAKKVDFTNMSEEQFENFYYNHGDSNSVKDSKIEVPDLPTQQMMQLRSKMKIYEPSKNDTRWVDYMTSMNAKERDVILHKSLNLPPESMSRDQLNKNVFSLFDRYYTVNPEMELTGLCHYVFITRPDLNIVEDAENYPIRNEVSQARNQFSSVWQTNPEVIRSLIAQGFGDHEFIPIITSRVESLQLPDYSLRTYMIEQPFSGYSMPISGHGIHSTTGGQFDLTIREMSDLSLHKLFQLWTGYINDINLGLYRPRNVHIHQNRCDYAVSVYDIVCAPDAKTVLFWVKYVGAFPINVPTSDLSFNRNGGVSNQFTVTFDYFLAEFMDYYSLLDFNINSGQLDHKTLKPISNADYENGPNKVGKVNYDSYSFDGISTNNDRTASKQVTKFLPIYGTGESLYKRPYIKFNTKNIANNHSKAFPTLEWEKY